MTSSETATKENTIVQEEEEEEEEDEEMEKKMKSEEKKKKSPAGVIYLSRIPTKMNVKLIREYFSSFGDVDRIYLEPEEKKRKNQPRTFSEGWIEFKKKSVAKSVAKKLNNQQIGGKRKNPWFHELWNIKYLRNFHWTHLNERIAYEKELRKQRLRQEINLAKKESNFFIQNYDKYEKQKRLEKKKAKNGGDVENEKEKDEVSNVDKRASRSTEQSNNHNDDNDDDDESGFKPKHKKFERKIKVAGNENFLKQIFS